MLVGHPHRMHVFENGLYMSASYGIHGVDVPSGGFTHMNPEAIRGIDQAVVVGDVDTPGAGNLTVTLEASQGLIVLESKTDIMPSSPEHLRLLVAQHSLVDRMYIRNVLESHGHYVEEVQDGEAAYNRILEAATSPETRFDAALVELDLGTDATHWDGFQFARRLRVYESRSALEDGSSAIDRTTLVAMSRLRGVVNDKLEAASAGFDKHMTLPTVSFVLPEDYTRKTNHMPDPRIDLSKSILEVEQAQERASYESFISAFESFLRKRDRGLDVSVLDFGAASTLDSNTESSLPGLTVGRLVQLQGTAHQINEALRNVLYFASSGSRGNVSIVVNATDLPLECSRDALHVFRSTLPGERQRLLSHLEAPKGTCDTTGAQTTSRTIHVAAVPTNHAPTILVVRDESPTEHLPALSTAVDVPLSLPVVEVNDPDFVHDVYKDSYGRAILPPVVVTVSAGAGRVGLKRKRGVSLRRSRADADRIFIFQAPLDVANRALASLTYVCRAVDGCMPGHADTVSLTVSDEGFSGKGGALTATTSMAIALVESTGESDAIDDADIDGNADDYVVGDDEGNDDSTDDEAADDEVQYLRPGSPEEGTTQNTVGSPGYRR